MRIRCPSCSATYEVADALLDPPRTVRCAKCAHDWMATSIDDASPPPEPIINRADEADSRFDLEPAAESTLTFGDTPLSAIERLSSPSDLPPRPRRRDRLLTAAWAATFAALAALGVGGYIERDELMRQWPASKRVYATLGLIPLDMKGGAPDLKPRDVDAKDGPVKAAPEKGPAR